MTSQKEDVTTPDGVSKDLPALANTSPMAEQYFDLLDSLGYLGRCDDASEMPPITDLEEESGHPKGGGSSRVAD